MVKIIHVLAGKANPNTMNGVNKVVDALANEQLALGFDVMVVGIANNTEKRHDPKYGYYLFKKTGYFTYPKDALSLLLMQSDENSVFHFHSVFIPWFLPLINDLKKNNRKHIFLTPHGQYVTEAMKRSIMKRIFFNLFDKNVIRSVEAVHVIGCETENNSYLRNNAKRIVTIPNGYSCESISLDDIRPSFVIGYLGRLECGQKGLDVLLPAFVKYHKIGGKAQLHIAGLGIHEQLLKKMVSEFKASNYIRFIGKVYDEDKWNFIKGCAAMITPSRWDGVPTSCLEAASARCPQLVTASTNLGPYITKYNAGLVIAEANEDDIVKMLLDFDDIYSDPKRYESMCDGARKMIVEELNWHNIAAKMVKELYEIQ